MNVSPISTPLAVGFVVVAASLCFVQIKEGLDYAPPLLFAALRTLLAGIVILTATVLLQGRVFPAPLRFAWIVPLGLFATTLTFGSMFLAPVFASAGLASVLGNLQPLVLLVLAAFFLNERITRGKLTALFLGVGGILFLFWNQLGSGAADAFTGASLALVSSTSAAVGSVIVKRMQPGRDLLPVVGWQLIFGSMVLLGISLLWETGGIVWTFAFIRILFFLSFFETALGTLAWFWLLQRNEAGRLGQALFLIPALGVVFAVVLRGESPAVYQWIGMGVILAGVAAAGLEPMMKKQALRV
ncbi:MAG: DMT family transporter [Opitutales bacterium]|nr:DMT family transporter [Opitutales bacterium]